MAAGPLETFPSNALHHEAQSPLVLIDPSLGLDLENPAGYRFVPRSQDVTIEDLVKWPLRYARGLGKATVALAHHALDGKFQIPGDQPEKIIMPVGSNKHERTLLLTEPDENLTDDADQAVNTVLMPGLTEMDIGSAYLLHQAIARRHPERRTITVMTPGVCLNAKPLSFAEGYSRELDVTAEENLNLLKWMLKNGPTSLVGTSLGSVIATKMAVKNQAANGYEQINATGVKLLSPAVGAKNVIEEGVEVEADASNRELVAKTTQDFFEHIPIDAIRMAIKHPEEAGRCMAVLGAYLAEPHKLPNRAAAMIGNLLGVQQGVEWEDLKGVAENYNLHVLGGELDPLVITTEPQWKALCALVPGTKFWVLEGAGHAMTMNAHGTAHHLAEMEASV